MLADLTTRCWVVIALAWLRTLALAGAFVCAGHLLDALVVGEELPVGRLLVAFVLIGVAAAAGGLAAAEPPRVQAQEEVTWRSRLVRAVLDGDPHQVPTGTLVSRLTDGVERVAGYRATFVAPTFAAFTAPVLVLVVLALAVDPGLAVRLALLVALVPVVVAFFMRVFRRPNARYRRTAAAVAGRFHELLRALGTFRLLDATAQGRSELARASATLEDEVGATLRRSQLMILVNDALFAVVMVTAAVAMALDGFADGLLSAGDVLTTVLLALLLHEPIDRLGRSFYVGMGGRAEQRELRRLLEVPPPPPPPQHAAAEGAPALTITGLSVDRGGRAVLREVNASVPAGGMLAVVGPTGAGKSTLALALQGLLPTRSGQISVAGRPQGTADLRALVRSVRQSPYLFTGTIAENLRLARPQATDEELWDALGRVHLRTEVAAMPATVHTPVGEGGTALSGGQVRRLALARALLSAAPVLILDEPTADLDRRSEHLITRALTELRGQRTLVVIAHRLETTTAADGVLVLENGAVVDAGPPGELTDRSGYYAAATATESLGVSR